MALWGGSMHAQLLLEARRLRPLEDDLPAPLLIGLKIEGVLGGRIRKD